MAARTIPFPNLPGTAAARRQSTPPAPPQPGAAKLSPALRRYRGLQLVTRGLRPKLSDPVERLAQTRAIVAQVEREVAEQARRRHETVALILLNAPKLHDQPAPARSPFRSIQSLFPAGL